MKKIRLLIAIAIIFLIGINSLAYAISSDCYDINKDLIQQISSATPDYVTIDKIPEDFITAIIAVEDKRFYEHHGFDMLAIGRAFLTNLKAGEIKEGGSTITQQLAKNLFLSSERTYSRKLQELALSIRLENQYSKDEILEMYTNVIYYGAGAYGLQEASQTFFNKDVGELSLAECAMLAGMPQAPSLYNPVEHPKQAHARQETVLAIMSRHNEASVNKVLTSIPDRYSYTF